MLRYVSLASGFALSLVFFACSDDSTSGGAPANGADGGTSTTPGADGSSTTPGPGANADFEGTWNSNCVTEAAGWNGRYKLVMTNGVMTSTYHQYKQDPTCSDTAKLAVEWIAVSKDWNLTDRNATPNQLERTMLTNTIKMIDSTLQGLWHPASGCGPHELNVVQDVRGKTCWNLFIPTEGGKQYDIVQFLTKDQFQWGLTRPGKTEESPDKRPETIDVRYTFTREGATSADGFIEATVDGELVRAEQNPASPNVVEGYLQISASTAALPPWKTWLLQIPRAVGQYTCKTAPSPTYINYGFTQDNLPVLWDTEQSGGNDCSINVTKAPTAKGDTIEGTFSGVVGDGKGAGHNVTAGSFKIRLTK